jgi:hypothetical protein
MEQECGNHADMRHQEKRTGHLVRTSAVRYGVSVMDVLPYKDPACCADVKQMHSCVVFLQLSQLRQYG